MVSLSIYRPRLLPLPLSALLYRSLHLPLSLIHRRSNAQKKAVALALVLYAACLLLFATCPPLVVFAFTFLSFDTLKQTYENYVYKHKHTLTHTHAHIHYCSLCDTHTLRNKPTFSAMFSCLFIFFGHFNTFKWQAHRIWVWACVCVCDQVRNL